MKFEVHFVQRFMGGSIVLGKGGIHLNETALLLEGEFPLFYLPLVADTLRSLICEQGMRTVPYSRIVEHRLPGFSRRYHQLAFRFPDGKKKWVAFRIKQRGNRRELDRELATGIEEYRQVTRSLMGV